MNIETLGVIVVLVALFNILIIFLAFQAVEYRIKQVETKMNYLRDRLDDLHGKPNQWYIALSNNISKILEQTKTTK